MQDTQPPSAEPLEIIEGLHDKGSALPGPEKQIGYLTDVGEFDEGVKGAVVYNDKTTKAIGMLGYALNARASKGPLIIESNAVCMRGLLMSDLAIAPELFTRILLVKTSLIPVAYHCRVY
ncbi:hypothetical protein MTO96_037195 [Rhipicephalus appendiculatus]